MAKQAPAFGMNSIVGEAVEEVADGIAVLGIQGLVEVQVRSVEDCVVERRGVISAPGHVHEQFPGGPEAGGAQGHVCAEVQQVFQQGCLGGEIVA